MPEAELLEENENALTQLLAKVNPTLWNKTDPVTDLLPSKEKVQVTRDGRHYALFTYLLNGGTSLNLTLSVFVTPEEKMYWKSYRNEIKKRGISILEGSSLSTEQIWAFIRNEIAGMQTDSKKETPTTTKEKVQERVDKQEKQKDVFAMDMDSADICTIEQG